MKKFLYLIFAILMVISFVSCEAIEGFKEYEDGDDETKKSAVDVETTNSTTVSTNQNSSVGENNTQTQAPSDDGEENIQTEYPSCTDEDAVTHYATIAVENYGTIKLELYGKVAPITVNNFETLANKGFYDGLTFHRIMEDFMMQGGCPEGNGTGGNTDENGNELNIKGEFYYNSVYNDISHIRGVISMARSYFYDSASSQFFIMHADATYLDGQYAGFGRVIEGMDVVDAVCKNSQPIDDNGTIPAEAQPKILSIRVQKAN